MTTTATGMLNVCRSQIGYREGLDNDNKYGRWYGWDNVAYCAIGLTWAAAQANATDIMLGRYAYCPYWVAAFRKAGQFFPYTAAGRPGDIVFFDWSGHHGASQPAQHVGIVEENDEGVLVTVEFNTVGGMVGDQSDGEGVWRRRRSNLYVIGYGRPRYASEVNIHPLPSHAGGQMVVPLVIDGVWGRKTTAMLQRWLALIPDGVIDRPTRTSLQARLHVAVDGAWGPITRRALQRFLGVTQDGVWGPDTAKSLQRFLNRALV